LETVSGYLEIHDKGFGFLRDIERNFQAQSVDTFVPAHLISRLRLREGVWIEGAGVPGSGKNRNLRLEKVATINNSDPKAYAQQRPLQDQVSLNPTERFHMRRGPDDITGRALDLIVPMGKGQRGLIISPPKSGKTTLLRHMANAVTDHHPEVDAFVLLVDERPEEVTDFKRGLQGAHVLFSSADQSVGQHMRMTRLAMHTAMRAAEAGRDAVVFIDSLTRMARAFNVNTRSHGRTLSGGLAATAMEMPRRIFGAARDIEDGGSLTIIATILVDTGSRMDDIIYQEFKGTGNMDLVLNRECAEQRIFPAIDVHQSGTRKEHLLLTDAEYKEAVRVRRGLSRRDVPTAMSDLIDYLDKKS
jgi:transcription termination factor Rho